MAEPLDESIAEPGESIGRLRGSAFESPHREFRDSAGRLWTASESPIPYAEWTPSDEETWRAGYGVGWLCFQSGGTRRRRRLYPQHWGLLSDDELERLCLFARDVK